MINIKKTIFDRLKGLRTYHGYSQSEIASMLNIRQSNYANWELNKRTIPLGHLVELANIYKVNIDYLVGLTDSCITLDNVIIDKNIISLNLKKLIIENNMNIKKFAEKINYSERAIHYYLKQERLIPLYVLLDIARIFEISIDYLLGRTSIKKINDNSK